MYMMGPNLTVTDVPPAWNSEPMFHLPSWGEPVVCLGSSMSISLADNLSDRPVDPCQCYVLHKAEKLQDPRQQTRRQIPLPPR